MRSYLIFTGTGPILALSTYPELTDERLVDKLRHKGISKFIAYEVALPAVQQRYGQAFASIARDLGAREIDDYFASGEPLDKAGAYAIQGGAARFVERCEGDFENVVGLPLAATADLLERAGLAPADLSRRP